MNHGAVFSVQPKSLLKFLECNELNLREVRAYGPHGTKGRRARWVASGTRLHQIHSGKKNGLLYPRVVRIK